MLWNELIWNRNQETWNQIADTKKIRPFRENTDYLDVKNYSQFLVTFNLSPTGFRIWASIGYWGAEGEEVTQTVLYDSAVFQKGKIIGMNSDENPTTRIVM